MNLPDEAFVRYAMSKWRPISVSGMAHVFILEQRPGDIRNARAAFPATNRRTSLYHRIASRLQGIVVRLVDAGEVRRSRQPPPTYPPNERYKRLYELKAIPK